MAVLQHFTFSIEAMVWGYHVYQNVWKAIDGEVLECSREIGNHNDPYTVTMIKSSGEVGSSVTVCHDEISSIFISNSAIFTSRI